MGKKEGSVRPQAESWCSWRAFYIFIQVLSPRIDHLLRIVSKLFLTNGFFNLLLERSRKGLVNILNKKIMQNRLGDEASILKAKCVKKSLEII